MPTKIDSMLVNIDKTGLATNILYDRIVPWSRLSSFNNEINVSNVNHFEQSLLDIYNASNQSKFIDHHNLRNLYSNKNFKSIVDIGIINVEYNQLNYNTSNPNEGGLILNAEKFESNNNGTEFIKNQTLIISPLKKGVVGPDITFNFDNGFLFEEVGQKELTSIVADFGTGQNHLIYENGNFLFNTLQINYNDAGYKTLNFLATFTDNTTLSTNALLYVGFVSHYPPNGLTADGEVDATIPFPEYFNGPIRRGHLEYRIFYRNGGSKLFRPIIVVDGFDPEDKRKIEDSDVPDVDPDKHDSMREFMSFNDGNNDVDLIENLNIKGYDVILVNHPTYSSLDGGDEIDGGADYIERNALTHVELYKQLNDSLSSNNSQEQLVIIGPSMGGQISRYALAYMEKPENNQPDHNVRLWVSIDSPHLGANIPIGLQTLVNQVASSGNADAQDFVNKQLGSIAAKQQLIEQFNGYTNSNYINHDYMDGRTIGQGFSENRGSNYYTTYYNDLFENGKEYSKGYPENLRKIALVNGSLKGNKVFNLNSNQQSFYTDDSEQALNIRGYVPNCIPWPFCSDIHAASLEAFSLPPFGQTNKISRFKKSFNDSSKFATNINSRGNMDNISGGWFDGYDKLAGSIDTDPFLSSGSFWFMGGLLTILAVIDIDNVDFDIEKNEYVHSFIPTFSSLGILQPDQSWSQNLDRDLTCNNEIPFDTYFGPKNNEQHTSFTQESVNWLLGELDGVPQPATVYRGNNGPIVYGPAIICHDDLVTYDLDLCSAVYTQWEVSSNLDIETFSPNFVVVSPKSFVDNQYGAQGFIKATIGNVVINRNIWIGLPTTPEDIEGPDVIHVGSTNNYSTDNGGGAQSYQWSLPQPFDPNTDIVSYIDGTSDHWQMLEIYSESKYNNGVFSGNGGYEGEMEVIGVNSCGDGRYAATLEISQNNSGPCPTCYDPIQVVPVPNSANEEFKLDFAQHPPGTYYIYIFDANSNIMYQGETENYKKTVDTTDLPNGIYYLHIHDGNEVTSQQLYIQH